MRKQSSSGSGWVTLPSRMCTQCPIKTVELFLDFECLPYAIEILNAAELPLQIMMSDKNHYCLFDVCYSLIYSCSVIIVQFALQKHKYEVKEKCNRRRRIFFIATTSTL